MVKSHLHSTPENLNIFVLLSLISTYSILILINFKCEITGKITNILSDPFPVNQIDHNAFKLKIKLHANQPAEATPYLLQGMVCSIDQSPDKHCRAYY